MCHVQALIEHLRQVGTAQVEILKKMNLSADMDEYGTVTVDGEPIVAWLALQLNALSNRLTMGGIW